ncbi:hypothetical protein FH972_021233 [Carpinus fangiana]|uniref:Uncharacterized protein n=1 Tax=Carpinus fangiana TaxID=176857 RepID=A0A5N6KNR8_9ROSI|nr:hypothetical protein FH972_021233 [Carpinus fangiana]
MWILPLLGYLGVVAGFIFLVLAIGTHSASKETAHAHDLWRDWHSCAASAPRRLPLDSCRLQCRKPHSLPPEPAPLPDCETLGSSVHCVLCYPYQKFSGRDPYAHYPTFTEIASFFGICVWLVPFSLFVSLSASENVLPTMGSEYATGEGSSFTSSGQGPTGTGGTKKERTGMAKAAVDSIRGWVGESGEVLGFWKGSACTYCIPAELCATLRDSPDFIAFVPASRPVLYPHFRPSSSPSSSPRAVPPLPDSPSSNPPVQGPASSTRPPISYTSATSPSAHSSTWRPRCQA